MSLRTVCDSCDERVKVGESCVEVCSIDEVGVPTLAHYHDLCWERNVDHLVPRPTLPSDVRIRKRIG